MDFIPDFEFLTDTDFLSEIIEHLHDSCGISSFFVNNQGEILHIVDYPYPPLAVSRDFPFSTEWDTPVSALQCSASTEEQLIAAEPHIRFALKGLQRLLAGEAEAKQMVGEVLELSEQVNFLFAISKKMSGTTRIETFCDTVQRDASDRIGADASMVLLREAGKSYRIFPMNMSEAEAERLLNSEVFRKISGRSHSVISTLEDGSSILVSPLHEKTGESAGNLIFVRRASRRTFTAYEKKLVTILDVNITNLLETLKLYENMRTMYLNTVKALAAAIDAKDRYTHGHSYRVAQYSKMLACEMGMGGDSCSDIEIAGFMHDLGKIAVSEKVLLKPGMLDEAEYREIKKHPEFTAKILDPACLPKFIVDGAVQHHERLDGTGYPYGLQGSEISMPAKIIAVADVFDAMTSHRPYRNALSVESALAEIQKGVGISFELGVVCSLLQLVRKKETRKELEKINPDISFENYMGIQGFVDCSLEYFKMNGGTANKC